MEGEPEFLPALERLQTLYPRSYAQGTTSTSEGAEQIDGQDVKLSAHTHSGATALDPSLGGGDPSPTRPSLLVDTWLNGASTYGGQVHLDISALAGEETLAGADTLGVI